MDGHHLVIILSLRRPTKVEPSYSEVQFISARKS